MKPRADLTRNRARATTAEIIGTLPGRFTVPVKWQDQYQNLLRLRDQLRQHKDDLAASAREELPNYSLHMADAGTDQYDLDFALSMMSSDQNALYEIEQALNRIRNGTYGVCELTGDSIEEERLEAIPWTRFSATAQRQLEDHGAVGLRRLAKIGRLAEPEASEEEETEEEA